MADYNITALPEYIEQNKSELITASVTGATSLTYPITVITGVKHKQTINFAEVSAPFQVGGTCAFNSSGDTVFTQSTLTVADVKVENEFCPKTLEEKYTQKYLRPGVKQDSMPLAEFITGEITTKIKSQMEQVVWQGNTSFTFDTNLKQFNGWVAAVDAGSPTIVSSGTITSGNIIDILQSMYTSAPARILSKDLEYRMGKDVFRLLVIALGNENLYHVSVNQSTNNWEMTFPYFNIKVVGVDGLNNNALCPSTYQDRIFLTYTDNYVYVTDLENDDENFEMWYSQDDRKFKLSVEWKAGTAIKFPAEVVTYKRA